MMHPAELSSNYAADAGKDRTSPVDLLYRIIKSREVQRAELPFIATLEDYDIFTVCAYHFLTGRPLNLKLLLSLEIGPAKTIQRRLDRLKRLSIVQERVDQWDRRTKWLILDELMIARLTEFGRKVRGRRWSERMGNVQLRPN